MTERTVTEAEVIAAMNKHSSRHDAFYSSNVFDELFPELPKVGELVKLWDSGDPNLGFWDKVLGFNVDGHVIIMGEEGDDESWNSYRRQTPAERGEG
ncbi:MAG: hypothetical protein ACI9N9_001208 [Enterobacterales bacterium]|jgi:hypothetical protein